MTNARPLRQSPRLRPFDYVGTHAYNLGTVTRNRLPLLNDADTVEFCMHALHSAYDKYSFACLAYCFMPDHVHLLAASEDGESVERFMRHFKQLSGHAYKQATGEHLWQTSYYDHVLRREEAIRPIAEYIWENPVRKRLVRAALDWPYSGPRENMIG
jgi:putative transposase